MQINVVRNAKRNIVFGAINKIIVLLCPFVERQFIITILGAEYLGLGSLYTSVISVLSLSELGFNSAMVYNMYKPAAEGDTKKINSLLNYYRSVYRIIGLVVLLLGLAIIPVLPHLIKGSYPESINLTKLYVIYLANAAVSYFLFAYLTSIIVVHQRDDINSIINSCIKIGLTVTQIAVLYFTRNYYLFSFVMLAFTVLSNLLTGWRVKTLFPQYKPEGKIDAKNKASIKKLVAGTFVQQACAVTRNSLDSICISAFLGLTMTAIYNNYYIILNGITSFVRLIAVSFTGGVGNHVAQKSISENFREMKSLDFIYLWVSGWCAICLLCLYQPFMTLWMGSEMLLSFTTVLLLCIYFYLLKLGDIRTLYASANGLWWEHRFRAIGETVLNLALNIILGKIFGVNGIVLATMISLFVCNYIWSVYITFRLYFTNSSRKDYYLYQGKYTLITIPICALTYGLCCAVSIENPYLMLVYRVLLCAIVPNLLYFIVYRNSAQFIAARNKVLRKTIHH